MKKACQCHKSMAPSMHKDKCLFAPIHLKAALAKNAVDREYLAKQLAKTTLSPKQQKHILDDFYGGGGASSA